MIKYLNLRANIALGLIFAFLATTIGPMPAYAQEFYLPAPGQMVALGPVFSPAVLRGIKLDPKNPFRFHFFVDSGDVKLKQDELKAESSKLIKYFLASLTIPEKDLWVNLSPYEKNRIVPEEFGKTEMGRDLLAEDYMLKQITASLIYPEDKIGKEFWAKVYAQAQAKYGTTNIPINTFNKVWIVPDKAVVYENGGTAFVLESHLKVMLEQDYLSLQKHNQKENMSFPNASVGKLDMNNTRPSTKTFEGDKGISSLGSHIVREIIIPALTKEVNEGKNFSQLRQVFYSLILATWYKTKIKDSIFNKIYSDRNKIGGVNVSSGDKDRIYQDYLKAFKKGVFNYIKEEPGALANQGVPRKYFSGGVEADQLAVQYKSPAQVSKKDFAQLGAIYEVKGDMAMMNNAGQANGRQNDLERVQKINELIGQAVQEVNVFQNTVQLSNSALANWLGAATENMRRSLGSLMIKIDKERLDSLRNAIHQARSMIGIFADEKGYENVTEFPYHASTSQRWGQGMMDQGYGQIGSGEVQYYVRQLAELLIAGNVPDSKLIEPARKLKDAFEIKAKIVEDGIDAIEADMFARTITTEPEGIQVVRKLREKVDLDIWWNFFERLLTTVQNPVENFYGKIKGPCSIRFPMSRAHEMEPALENLYHYLKGAGMDVSAGWSGSYFLEWPDRKDNEKVQRLVSHWISSALTDSDTVMLSLSVEIHQILDKFFVNSEKRIQARAGGIDTVILNDAQRTTFFEFRLTDHLNPPFDKGFAGYLKPITAEEIDNEKKAIKALEELYDIRVEFPGNGVRIISNVPREWRLRNSAERQKELMMKWFFLQSKFRAAGDSFVTYGVMSKFETLSALRSEILTFLLKRWYQLDKEAWADFRSKLLKNKQEYVQSKFYQVNDQRRNFNKRWSGLVRIFNEFKPANVEELPADNAQTGTQPADVFKDRLEGIYADYPTAESEGSSCLICAVKAVQEALKAGIPIKIFLKESVSHYYAVAYSLSGKPYVIDLQPAGMKIREKKLILPLNDVENIYNGKEESFPGILEVLSSTHRLESKEFVELRRMFDGVWSGFEKKRAKARLSTMSSKFLPADGAGNGKVAADEAMVIDQEARKLMGSIIVEYFKIDVLSPDQWQLKEFKDKLNQFNSDDYLFPAKSGAEARKYTKFTVSPYVNKKLEFSNPHANQDYRIKFYWEDGVGLQVYFICKDHVIRYGVDTFRDVVPDNNLYKRSAKYVCLVENLESARNFPNELLKKIILASKGLDLYETDQEKLSKLNKLLGYAEKYNLIGVSSEKQKSANEFRAGSYYMELTKGNMLSFRGLTPHTKYRFRAFWEYGLGLQVYLVSDHNALRFKIDPSDDYTPLESGKQRQHYALCQVRAKAFDEAHHDPTEMMESLIQRWLSIGEKSPDNKKFDLFLKNLEHFNNRGFVHETDEGLKSTKVKITRDLYLNPLKYNVLKFEQLQPNTRYNIYLFWEKDLGLRIYFVSGQESLIFNIDAYKAAKPRNTQVTFVAKLVKRKTDLESARLLPNEHLALIINEGLSLKSNAPHKDQLIQFEEKINIFRSKAYSVMTSNKGKKLKWTSWSWRLKKNHKIKFQYLEPGTNYIIMPYWEEGLGLRVYLISPIEVIGYRFEKYPNGPGVKAQISIKAPNLEDARHQIRNVEYLKRIKIAGGDLVISAYGLRNPVELNRDYDKDKGPLYKGIRNALMEEGYSVAEIEKFIDIADSFSSGMNLEQALDSLKIPYTLHDFYKRQWKEVLPEVLDQFTWNRAMLSETRNGGINLNPAQMNMQVKKEGEDFKFDFNGTEIDAAQVTGATFTIRTMTPVADLMQVLSLADNKSRLQVAPM